MKILRTTEEGKSAKRKTAFVLGLPRPLTTICFHVCLMNIPSITHTVPPTFGEAALWSGYYCSWTFSFQFVNDSKNKSGARSLEEGRKKSVNYCRRPNMSRSVRVLKKQMRGHFSPRRRGRRLGRWGRQLGDVLDHILGLCLAQEPQNTKGA
jgi:hypothetical protein